MKRFVILACAVSGAALVGATSTALSAERVVGGTQTQVQSAPWTVSIKQTTSDGLLLCTGSVLDSLHILTAAHCVYDENGALASASTLTVRAGISNFNNPLASDVEQDRTVAFFRVHPGYTYSTTVSPDDVAVLTLSSPLDLSGPAVQAVSLPSASMTYPAGVTAQLAGFGRETGSGSADGSLNSLTVTVDQQGDCGGTSNTVEPWDNAIALCASGANSSICNGDSGSGLVTADTSHTLIGIADAVPPGCNPGSHGIYVYVGTPEILSFIQGNNSPVTAPRFDSTTYLDLYETPPLEVGSRLECVTGNWQNNPSYTYAFIDSDHNRVLQQGPSATLTLNAQTVGATIACQVTAKNAGGSTVLETTSTTAVGAIPKLVIAPLKTVTAKRGKRVVVELSMVPGAGVSGKFSMCLIPPARVAPQACAERRYPSSLGARDDFALSLAIRSDAPLGTVHMTISAVAGVSHAQSKATLHVTR